MILMVTIVITVIQVIMIKYTLCDGLNFHWYFFKMCFSYQFQQPKKYISLNPLKAQFIA